MKHAQRPKTSEQSNTETQPKNRERFYRLAQLVGSVCLLGGASVLGLEAHNAYQGYQNHDSYAQSYVHIAGTGNNLNQDIYNEERQAGIDLVALTSYGIAAAGAVTLSGMLAYHTLRKDNPGEVTPTSATPAA